MPGMPGPSVEVYQVDSLHHVVRTPCGNTSVGITTSDDLPIQVRRALDHARECEECDYGVRHPEAPGPNGEPSSVLPPRPSVPPPPPPNAQNPDYGVAGIVRESHEGPDGETVIDRFDLYGVSTDNTPKSHYGATADAWCECDWLGEGTPRHAPSAMCRDLRPDAPRSEGA